MWLCRPPNLVQHIPMSRILNRIYYLTGVYRLIQEESTYRVIAESAIPECIPQKTTVNFEFLKNIKALIPSKLTIVIHS